LRDILKSRFTEKMFSKDEWKTLGEMLRKPPRGGMPWGFKRFGPQKVVDESLKQEVSKIAEYRIKGLTANGIAREFGTEPEVTVGKLKRLRQPVYKEILGDGKWKEFLDADDRIKSHRL